MKIAVRSIVYEVWDGVELFVSDHFGGDPVAHVQNLFSDISHEGVGRPSAE